VFKNVMAYRIAPTWAMSLTQVEAGLQPGRFVECGASQEKSVGWIEPRGQAHGPLAESVGGQWIFRLRIETRSLPGAVVTRKAHERMAQIEASTGRKPGKREMRDIKDDVRLQLLPMAFTQQSDIWVWLDPQAHWLVIDAGSQGKADEVLGLLVKCLDGLALSLVNTAVSPTAAMAEWLVSQEPPAGFSVDRECELKAADESRAVVRYARHPLDTEEVRQHVQGGKLPTRLALTWEGRVSFMLTEQLQLKKLAFLEGVFEQASTRGEEGFDADVAIATAEIGKLLPDLLEALGGEATIG
jgi:recombination associated protein RdgC